MLFLAPVWPAAQSLEYSNVLDMDSKTPVVCRCVCDGGHALHHSLYGAHHADRVEDASLGPNPVLRCLCTH